MNSFKIDKNLYKEIEAFVNLNELGDVDAYINKLLKEAFMVKKYDDIVDFGKTIKVHAKTVKSEAISSIQKKEEKKENNNEETDLYNE